MKKRMLSVLMAVLMVFQSSTIIFAFEETGENIFSSVGTHSLFTDTENHWAREIIDELAVAGIISGKGNGIYDPDGTVTHAEFAKLLICSVEEYDEYASFAEGIITDVKPDDWYYSYVASALNTGIVEGGAFSPNSSINRGETAIWISRSLGIEGAEDCRFTDIYDEEVKNAVSAAYSYGIITGYNDYTYGPGNTLTRAEAAALIQRVMRTYKELKTPRVAKNTAEFSGNVIEVKNNGKNQIVSADASTGQLVFENCTENIKNIKPGRILHIESCKEFPEGGVAKVESAEKTKNGVTIKTSAPSIDEVFSQIDIADTVSVSAENFVPGSSDDGIMLVTPNAGSATDRSNMVLSKDEKYALSLLDKVESQNPANNSDLLLFNFYAGAKAPLLVETVSFGENDISGSITVKSEILCDIFLSSATNKKTTSSIKVVCENSVITNLKYAKEAAYEKSWKLGTFKIPITGPLVVVADFELVFNAKGEFELNVNASQTTQFGISVKNGKASLINDRTNAVDLSADAEGELRLGPHANVGLGLTYLFDTVKFVDVNTAMGMGIHAETAVEHNFENTNGDASYSAHNTTPDEEGNVHICDLCIDGEIFAYINGDIGISEDFTDILGIKKLRFDLGEKTFTVSNWYYSVSRVDGAQFGLGKCPYVFKQIEITEEPKLGADVQVGDSLSLKTDILLYSDDMKYIVRYKWYKDGEVLPDYEYGSLDNSLNISSLSKDDSGLYYCVVYYPLLGEEFLSATSSDVYVDVKDSNSDIYFTVLSPSGYDPIDENVTYSLYAKAQTKSGAGCTYQWYKDGSPIPGATSEAYAMRPAKISDTGTYYCVATAVDIYGNPLSTKKSNNIYLEVFPATGSY